MTNPNIDTQLAPNTSKKPKGPRCNNWTFTLNNFTAEQELILQHLVEQGEATYVLYAVEHSGPRPDELPAEYSWTPHLQGYVQWVARKYQTACQTILKAAWFKAMGTARQNFVYITKGDILTIKQYPLLDPQYDQKIIHEAVWVEFGEMNRDLQNGTPTEKKKNLDTLIRQYDNIYDFMENEFAIFSHNMKALQFYYAHQDSKLPKNKPFVIWLAGKSGCGKSMAAHQISEYFPTKLWSSFSNTKWYDNLTARTQCVLFDDIRSTDITFSALLKLLDIYDLSVEQKGLYGGVKFNPKCVILTCPNVPEKEFINHNTNQVYEDIFQLVRRCQVIIEYRDLPSKGWYYQCCGNNNDCCQDRFLSYIQNLQEQWRIANPQLPEPAIKILQNQTQEYTPLFPSQIASE